VEFIVTSVELKVKPPIDVVGIVVCKLFIEAVNVLIALNIDVKVDSLAKSVVGSAFDPRGPGIP